MLCDESIRGTHNQSFKRLCAKFEEVQGEWLILMRKIEIKGIAILLIILFGNFKLL